MTFIYTEPGHRHHVEKARSRVPTGARFKKVTRLADSMKNAVKVDFLDGVTTFKKKVSRAALERAWQSGDYDELSRSIPWRELPKDMGPTGSRLAGLAEASAEIAIEHMPPQVNRELRFDTHNTRLTNYLRVTTGSLVTDIGQDVRAAIQNVVTQSFDRALTPRRAADIIKRSIGLNQRQQNALNRYEAGLRASGMNDTRVSLLTDQYEARLLDSRAMTIARTETRRAASNGQIEVWREGARQGYFDENTARKIWVVGPEGCDLCDPMDGVSVGLNEVWILADGTACDVPADSHPNCDCEMEISFGEGRKETGEE